MPTWKVQRGVTVIELMVTLTIIAILVSVSVPSFKQQIDSKRTQSVMASFITGMAYARSESVKIGDSVHLRSVEASNDWSRGWCVTTGENCKSNVIKLFEPPPAHSVKGSSASIDKFTFNAQGLLESPLGYVSLCPSGAKGKKVSVTLLGQALAQDCKCSGSRICE